MNFRNSTALAYNDTVVRQFAIMTVVWGVVGMLVGVVIASQLAWPELNFGIPWLSYGDTPEQHHRRRRQRVCHHTPVVHLCVRAEEIGHNTACLH